MNSVGIDISKCLEEYWESSNLPETQLCHTYCGRNGYGLFTVYDHEALAEKEPRPSGCDPEGRGLCDSVVITRRHAGAAGLLLFLALLAQEHDAGGRGKHHAHPQGHLAAIGSLDGGDILGGCAGTGPEGKVVVLSCFYPLLYVTQDKLKLIKINSKMLLYFIPFVFVFGLSF